MRRGRRRGPQEALDELAAIENVEIVDGSRRRARQRAGAGRVSRGKGLIDVLINAGYFQTPRRLHGRLELRGELEAI